MDQITTSSNKYFKHLLKISTYTVHFILCFFFPIPTIDAQNKQEEFTQDFISGYSELSKSEHKNYFELLVNSVKFVFNGDNALFLAAVDEIKNQRNISETESVEFLFRKNFLLLREKYVWVANKQFFKKNKDLLYLYSGLMCECVTKEWDGKDVAEILSHQKKCAARIVSDSSALNRIRQVAGNYTLNDVNRMQQHFVAAIYESCSIIANLFDNSLIDQAVSQYEQHVRSTIRRRVENVLKYFSNQEYASLKTIFPRYKEFSEQLTKGANLYHKPSSVYKTYVLDGLKRDSPPKVVIQFTSGNVQEIFTLQCENRTAKTTFSSISYSRIDEDSLHGDEQIIEIRADTVQQRL